LTARRGFFKEKEEELFYTRGIRKTQKENTKGGKQMKRFAFTAVAIIAVLAMAMPAFALDLTAKGSFRARSFFDSNTSLSKMTSDSDAYWDMRLRVRPTLTINDNLLITGRFDVYDNARWGTGTKESDGSLDFDKIWMAIKTDYGKVEIGRQTASVFGTLFMDSDRPADRIKYSYTLNELVVGAVYEKNVELDSFATTSNTDYDSYFLFGNWTSEMITGGLLAGWYQDKRGSEKNLTSNGATITNPNAVLKGPYGTMYASGKATPFDREFFFFNPYAIAKVQDFTIQGEIFYNIGKWATFDQKQYKNDNTYTNAGYAGGKLRDWDLDAWAWNLEGQYNFGPFNFQLGYAWEQGAGQIDPSKDNKISTLGTLGKDWQKLWILTGNEDMCMFPTGAAPLGGLGGWGNLSDNTGQSLGVNGAKIFYVGAGFKPIESVNLSVIYGNAKAEAPIVRTWSQDYGDEYDFNLGWNIMDNLKYSFIAAYLSAGNFFQYGDSTAKLENDYSLFQNLELSF